MLSTQKNLGGMKYGAKSLSAKMFLPEKRSEKNRMEEKRRISITRKLTPLALIFVILHLHLYPVPT